MGGKIILPNQGIQSPLPDIVIKIVMHGNGQVDCQTPLPALNTAAIFNQLATQLLSELILATAKQVSTNAETPK